MFVCFFTVFWMKQHICKPFSLYHNILFLLNVRYLLPFLITVFSEPHLWILISKLLFIICVYTTNEHLLMHSFLFFFLFFLNLNIEIGLRNLVSEQRVSSSSPKTQRDSVCYLVTVKKLEADNL